MKIGCIGCGNMASALLGGMLQKEMVLPEEILASDQSAEARKKAQESLGIRVTASNREAAETAELLILAVKPQFFAQVIEEIRDVVQEQTVVLSLAP